MGLRPIQKQSFGLKEKDRATHGDSVYTLKGGATIVNNRWIFFNDLKIDIQQTVTNYMKALSRRVFNQVGGILYVLIVVNEQGQVEVVPSISYNKNTTGEIRVFSNISGKVPLLLVKLTQDGSAGLTGIKRVKPEDIEVYKGYGNFTTRGEEGEEGPRGITGEYGITGYKGLTGAQGFTGYNGDTGAQGVAVQGATGPQGASGAWLPWISLTRPTKPGAEFFGYPVTGYAPLTVDFTDQSTGIDIEEWRWTFGDGNASSETGPQNIYTDPGLYTVSLTVSNEAGDDTETKVEYIEVSELETWIQDVVDDAIDGWNGTVDEDDDQVQNIPDFPF